MIFKFKNNKLLLKNIINKFIDNINDDFINILLNDDKNIMIFHNIHNINDIKNMTSFIIYRKIVGKQNIKYAILLFAVHPNIRNTGYGNLILDEFIQSISLTKSLKNKYIILHSLESSLDFYLNYGFEQLKSSKFLQNYEGLTKDTINNILQLNII